MKMRTSLHLHFVIMRTVKKRTIKDISERTGYSRSTISRVLTGKGYVRDSARKKIEEAIAELDYQPQEKHVTKEVRDMIMVIACQLDSEVQMKMVMAIQKKMREAGYRTAIISAEFDSNTAYQYIEYANEKNFGGVITLGILDTPEFREAVSKLSCPVVFLNQNVKGIHASIVKFDDKKVSRQAAQYLIDQGHRNIAFLSGYSNAAAISEREEGFREAMLDAAFAEKDLHIFHKDFNEASGIEFADEMIKCGLPYTAVIASTDILCFGLVKELQRKQVKIPDDISIICFGGSISEKTINSEITVVDYDFQVIGEELAGLLIDHMQHPLLKDQTILYQPRLLIRDSVKQMLK